MKRLIFILILFLILPVLHPQAIWAENEKITIKQVIAGLKKQIKKKPKNPELHLQLGYVYLQTNQLQEGEKELKKSIKIKSNYLEARLLLGNLYISTGRVEDGINQYKKAVRQRPLL